MILLSHPMSNTFVRALAETLHENGTLESLHTSVATYQGNGWHLLSKLSPLSDFGRRRFAESLRPLTYQYPAREIGRLAAGKLGLESLTKHETGKLSVDSVYKNHDRKVAAYLNSRRGVGLKGVYAYEDGALATFRAAKKLGLKCVYDLPIAYWETGRQLMQEEAERRPDWTGTLGGGIKDSAQKTERKNCELELADVVVVPGHFVMDSLPEWSRQTHCIVSHFGTPVSGKVMEPVKSAPLEGRLKVLFVGSMGQRKGLGDLFEAVKGLDPNRIELVVLGGLLESMDFYRSCFAGFRYEPTRSHEDVLALMRDCDIFCLPSIVEGRALVMQEAMSQGLPVIITPNTGGQDLVVEGETGFLVPIRTPDAIAEKIEWFDRNRAEIPRMSTAAVRHSAKYTWAAYGNTIVGELAKIMR
jgi:glycosyltransferase involved in cell wall biosynthesis